ncbi:pyroglutamyl-peptidase I [Hydrogenophaga sp. BPS33]|uniref:pyroglutamyl-peptidase I n=1 Tax=Hydrogenophaga sp. BPS33 TaxID=2651974 RepID=UPI00132006B7|nr:pyroglutamyl-peptidase I [Hydrogenophaga sp. BPS33]QHE88556.1 pyroglutamyl-peptidase I [Hydrogenophaga sp. BPS33]
MPARRRPTSPPSHTVLLTGFDAFGGATVNPSWQAVQALHGERLQDHPVVAAQLPTVFGESLRCLTALLEAHRPALVICVGQAGGRGAISLERVAINIDDAPMADNAGARPVDAPVRRGAPPAYFTGLPIKSMLAELQAAGLAAEVSQTAGTFVCNHVFYGLMHALTTRRSLRHTRGGFVHVPWLPEQGTPGMPLDDIVRGLRLAVQCALRVRKDAALAAGATH